MEPEFWHQRWAAGRIGFHQQKVNSRLRKLWPAFAAGAGAQVFVPLCGKSLDMRWLAAQNYSVLGVEISAAACRDFYAENNMPISRRPPAPNFPFAKFTGATGGARVRLWCGDFFKLTAAHLNGIRLVYDRAALIALPRAMRPAYARHLAELLRAGAKIFLISMEYDENKMQGPPFSVAEQEVRDLFADNFSVDVLARSSGPDIVGNLAARGLDTLNETVYALQRRPR